MACDANSDHDLFPSDWLFHHRWGKQDGAKVNGDAIKFIEIGGRTTAYVPKLQLKTGSGSTLNASSSRSAAAKIKKEIKTESDVMDSGKEDVSTTVRARSSRRGSSTSTSAAAKRARTTTTDASAAASGVRSRVARAVASAATRAVRLLR